MRAVILFAIFAAARPACAVGDPPGTGAATLLAIKLQTAMQAAHHKIMQLQVVQDAKVLWDSYVQARRYYDAIEKASQHRGGLFGYYSELFLSQLEEAAYSEWRSIQRMQDGDPNNPVRNLVEGAEAALNNKVDHAGNYLIQQSGKTIDAIVKAINDEDTKTSDRHKEVMSLVRQASTFNMTNQQRDNIELRATMLELQYLDAMNRMMRMQMTAHLDARKTELEEARLRAAATSGYSPRRGDASLFDRSSVNRHLKTTPGGD